MTQQSTKSILQINHLALEATVGGESRRLVEDFNLSVRQGEIVGLVGETGSGKSISMMAAVGLLSTGVRAVEGEVIFADDSISAMDGRRLRQNLAQGVALLFQNARGALNPFMRTKAQIERVLRLRGVNRQVRPHRIAEIMRSVGLASEEIGEKYAHQISGGQAQRVALACALATNPRLLIADEATTALDVTTQREVLQLLQALCRERAMGIVLITHNLALVAETCDRVALLHAGHIVEAGSVAEIFAQPLHPYTQGLMQAIPDVDTQRELIPMQGSVWGGQSLENRCRFSHRCLHAWERCNEAIPPPHILNNRYVRCYLHEPDNPTSPRAAPII
jgi:oligopeptide/dipeptide ABC transporter ATP-binding protein